MLSEPGWTEELVKVSQLVSSNPFLDNGYIITTPNLPITKSHFLQHILFFLLIFASNASFTFKAHSL